MPAGLDTWGKLEMEDRGGAYTDKGTDFGDCSAFQPMAAGTTLEKLANGITL